MFVVLIIFIQVYFSITKETVTSEQGDGVSSTETNHLADHTPGNTETTTINPNYKELEGELVDVLIEQVDNRIIFYLEYINTLPPNTARKILYELAIDEIETKGESNKSKFGAKLAFGLS